ncbi:MAG: hypothetical protein KJ955_00800 [Nanoarchaeota archaeon]|nr:hypothetical protein [Nanoarchaeota archaeon]
MQVLKTLKKVAAIGTGVAMLGATLTGALALDLKDYPNPFVVDGVYDDANVFVVGDDALSADTLASLDIVAGMQFLAKTPVVSSGGTVTVVGGKSQKVPLGQGLTNSTYFDRVLQDDDVSTLFDGKVNFGGTEYDTSEELQMCDDGGRKYGEPYVATSLMSDDDYKRDVFLEMGRDTVRYAYKFDKTINISATVSTTTPLEIDFLGKPLKITNVAAAGTGFTARVGDEYTLNAGDSVSVDVDGVKKTVKLDNVGTSNAVVNVDGVTKSITSGNTATVNGVECTVDSVTSRTALAESSAILVLGKQATETYADGDAYVGENVDSPNWVWDIRKLQEQGTTASQDCDSVSAANEKLVLRVENNFVFLDDSDKPTGVGQCLDLPNKYLSVCIDSLSVPDADFKELTMEYSENLDVSYAGCGTTFDAGTAGREPGIWMKFDVSEGLELRDSDYVATGMKNVTSTVKTKEIQLIPDAFQCNNSLGSVVPSGTGLLNVFYKTTDSPQQFKFYGAINTTDTTSIIARLNHGSTKETNGWLRLREAASGTVLPLKLTFAADTVGDLHGGSEELYMNWSLASNLSGTSLGSSTANEAGELYWNPGGRWALTDISTKDEDHRMAYGTLILDPKSNGGSQRVKLLVPSDLVYANIVVKGTNAKVTSGSTSYVPTKISPVSMVASQVTTPTNYNLVVVGGPCANPLAASVFDVSCDGWAYDEGEALVKLAANGDKVALLVAGTSATDTRRAGKAVAAYDLYAFSGSEALVKGTTMTDITVEKPSVAAPVVEAVADAEVAAE